MSDTTNDDALLIAGRSETTEEDAPDEEVIATSDVNLGQVLAAVQDLTAILQDEDCCDDYDDDEPSALRLISPWAVAIAIALCVLTLLHYKGDHLHWSSPDRYEPYIGRSMAVGAAVKLCDTKCDEGDFVVLQYGTWGATTAIMYVGEGADFVIPDTVSYWAEDAEIYTFNQEDTLLWSDGWNAIAGYERPDRGTARYIKDVRSKKLIMSYSKFDDFKKTDSECPASVSPNTSGTFADPRNRVVCEVPIIEPTATPEAIGNM